MEYTRCYRSMLYHLSHSLLFSQLTLSFWLHFIFQCRAQDPTLTAFFFSLWWSSLPFHLWPFIKPSLKTANTRLWERQDSIKGKKKRVLKKNFNIQPREGIMKKDPPADRWRKNSKNKQRMDWCRWGKKCEPRASWKSSCLKYVRGKKQHHLLGVEEWQKN